MAINTLTSFGAFMGVSSFILEVAVLIFSLLSSDYQTLLVDAFSSMVYGLMQHLEMLACT